MEVFVDLLPPSYTVKAAPSAKDSRRQRQNESNQNNQSDDVELSAGSESEKLKTTDNLPTGEDRRLGEDRRKNRINRGRWLESRDRNDRRTAEPAFFVKV